MIRPNRSTLKNLSDGDALLEEDPERQSRIAANLAKLDAAAPTVRNPPLQWKGYAWRTFDTVRGVIIKGTNSDAGAPKEPKRESPVALGALPESVASTDQLSILIKQGIKQRQWCRVIFPLTLMAVVTAVLLILGFSYAYGRFFAKDPCEVSETTKKWLLEHPRTSSKLDPNWKPSPSGIPKIIHQQWKTKDIPAGPYTTWHNEHLKLYPLVFSFVFYVYWLRLMFCVCVCVCVG